MDVLVISYLRVFSGCNQTRNIALSAHKRTAASQSDLLFKRTQLSAVWRFATIIMCLAVKAVLIFLLFAVVASHFNVLLLVVFVFQGLLSGCCTLLSNCCLLGIESWLGILIGKINYVLILSLLEMHKLTFGRLSPSASLQVTTYLVSKAHLLSHQPHPRTSSIRPSRPWAAAHWPIRGARARRPQPAWRPTCKVRRNASSCRTAGSWAAMWPWRAGEWPTMTYTRAGKFRRKFTWCENKMMWNKRVGARMPFVFTLISALFPYNV